MLNLELFTTFEVTPNVSLNVIFDFTYEKGLSLYNEKLLLLLLFIVTFNINKSYRFILPPNLALL